MQNVKYILLLCCMLCMQQAHSLWDFAVTTKSKIVFYDEQWQEITSSAHQFDQLSALTFDDAEDIIYFNDRLHNNGSIFALKLPTSLSSEDPHIVEKIVHRTKNESIIGIAYDPLNRNLFWTDGHNKKIYFASIDAAETLPPKVLLDLSAEDAIPDGIAIDICRRKLYWTNSNFKNATIERIDLDGSQREVIIKTDLYLPHGIVVDQLSDRIYYVVDQQGIHFSVESAKLDGSDRRVLVRGLYNVPFNLAVTKDAIFWTDLTHNSVWSHPKVDGSGFKLHETADEADAELTTNEREQSTEPVKVVSFKNEPRGIVSRTNLLGRMRNDPHCAAVVKKIKSRLLKPQPALNVVDVQLEKMEREYCLNGGDFVKQRNTCICQMGYKGARCGTSECYNYCVHGTCSISPAGFPKCACQHGFYGERCHLNKCSRHCLNDGVCKIDEDGEPICECKENFGGEHCEQNSTEICSLFCRLLKHEPETHVPYGCHDICEELAQRSEDGITFAVPKYPHLEVCENAVAKWNSTVIIVLVCGVVLSLCLVVLIVHGLRRFYKPARPRIKKTFVVRKQATMNGTDTPLTNRPIATEQCEITIENCCNMNICDTPCFDPKLVQQTLSRDNSTKEDKKMLIHNMEDELY